MRDASRSSGAADAAVSYSFPELVLLLALLLEEEESDLGFDSFVSFPPDDPSELALLSAAAAFLYDSLR